MAEEEVDLRPEFQARGQAMLDRLSAGQVQDLLVKCWMSHDARWFMAVAQEYGLEAAGRLNQVAAHAVGLVEAKRLAKALDLSRPRTVEDLILLQETFIGLVGPNLMDYQVVKTGPDSFEVRVERCFAHQNVVRAGVAEHYDCGIFARVGAWPEALGVDFEMTPPLGRCLKVAGEDCVYRFTIKN
ncbi:MAG: hypothetical protein KJ621_03060 [Proteobacteria bacterium]|nr:hypothetical protein [Pseudomonadota bacterium]MBU1740133.1 hypothetical protein [Pseudomonadota bacterium]